MGQRLFVTIGNGENEYYATGVYRWGGYTKDAYDIASAAIKHYLSMYETRKETMTNTEIAVEMLEATGATCKDSLNGVFSDNIIYTEQEDIEEDDWGIFLDIVNEQMDFRVYNYITKEDFKNSWYYTLYKNFEDAIKDLPRQSIEDFYLSFEDLDAFPTFPFYDERCGELVYNII